MHFREAFMNDHALRAIRKAEAEDHQADYYWVAAEAAADRVRVLQIRLIYRTRLATRESDYGCEDTAAALARRAEEINEELEIEVATLTRLIDQATAAELSARLYYEEAEELTGA